MKADHENPAELRRRRGREIYGEIGKVLFWHWDPIGVKEMVKEEDEYDAYIGPVYRLLASGGSDQKIVEYLIQTERETIGLSVPSNADQLNIVIEHLRKIDIRGE